ncbi:hypothetical protein L1987_75647 [Smallanthus sonchifolius]|uniref:Uncharacterized protein n=1 Tax=Smallanthus sonchifolius TaxID=185202 RepID=A0ACB9A649_9ASTR|nr:hypothetical protein L1987_75647 [Smallanthus sonchifolius]
MDIRTGFMTVFVVSGSVVILAHQIHKRLLSDFMKKIEFEMGPCNSQTKKKVRFFDEELFAGKEDVVKLPPPNVAVTAIEHGGDNKKCRKTMPLNWQVMYKGIINYRNSIYIQ